MKKTFASLLLFLSFLNGFSQQKHWIFFRDKDLSAKTEISEKAKINRRMLGLSENQFTDIPVNKKYISDLQNLDIQPIIKSKWLNIKVLQVRNIFFINWNISKLIFRKTQHFPIIFSFFRDFWFFWQIFVSKKNPIFLLGKTVWKS